MLRIHNTVNVITQCKHPHLEMPLCCLLCVDNLFLSAHIRLSALKAGACLCTALKKIQPISQEQTMISLSYLLKISLLEFHVTEQRQKVCNAQRMS